jgi:hypothetical protein
MTYKPPKRTVAVQLYARSMGWVRGDLHVPSGADLRTALSDDNAFIRMTDVKLPNDFGEIPFLALNKRAVIVIAATDPGPEDPLVARAKTTHRLACIFDAGFITGDAKIMSGTRLSDFLATHKGFLELHDAVLHQGDQNALRRYLKEGHRIPSGAAMPVALINPTELFGVIEPPAAETDRSTQTFAVPMG